MHPAQMLLLSLRMPIRLRLSAAVHLPLLDWVRWASGAQRADRRTNEKGNWGKKKIRPANMWSTDVRQWD